LPARARSASASQLLSSGGVIAQAQAAQRAAVAAANGGLMGSLGTYLPQHAATMAAAAHAVQHAQAQGLAAGHPYAAQVRFALGATTRPSPHV
jgi:hypothetical protein